MSTQSRSEDYLLQVTIRKTKNPAVSRILSVPISINFRWLHLAIRVVFAKEGEHDRYHSEARYHFNVVDGNPLGAGYDELQDSLLRLNVDGSAGTPNTGPRPREVWDSSEVTMPEVFSNVSFRDRYMTYTYDGGNIYVIQMLGRSNEDKDGRITCIGGQGTITKDYWHQHRVATEVGDQGGPSASDFDLRAVQYQLERLDNGRYCQEMEYAKSQNSRLQTETTGIATFGLSRCS